MKYLFKIFIITIVLTIWALAYSSSLFYKLSSEKIIPDVYKYGDLYRLSFLPEFKESTPDCNFTPTLKKQKSNTDLYILGDSFTFKSGIKAEYFNCDTAYFIHWDTPLIKIQDTTKNNILIIETVERSVRARFAQNNFFFQDQQENSAHITPNVLSIGIFESFEKNMQSFEERLINILFNWDFILYFRELKAKIDHYFFDRKSNSFVLGKDKKHIFYYDEAEPSYGYSSFYPYTPTEQANTVSNAQKTIDYFNELGFKHVVFSIIPNKVTILEPNYDKYNNLLPNTELEFVKNEIPHISMLNILKANGSRYYYTSDSHWNCAGKKLWIDKINEFCSK